jgi:hypothetical protein
MSADIVATVGSVAFDDGVRRLACIASLQAERTIRIVALAPLDDTEQMTALRNKLSVARDVASSCIGSRHRHGDAALSLYALIARAVCQFIFARVEIERLEAAVAYCRRLLISAREIDRLEGWVA